MTMTPKILIVDDNPNNRLAIRTILKGGSAELHEASNGFDALSMSLAEDYAMILLDVQMPEMDGFEVCEQLRTNPKTSDTPVIFLSAAYKEDIDKIRGYVSGATDYLTKPIEDHILKAKVQVFLRLYTQKQLLQESEQRLKFALEGAGDGVWDWNVATAEITFSKGWYEIQGFDEGSIGPALQDWKELLHPDDLAIAELALQAHFEGKTPNFSCEHRVRCKDGEYKWILARGMVVARGAEGQPLRAIGTHTDITNRKLAEIERDRLLKIIMQAPDFIATMDMQARLKFLNPAGARMIGLPQDVDLASLEIKDMHPVWAARKVLEIGIPAALLHGCWQGETALLNRRTGRETPVSQLLLVHRDSDGVPQQLSTIMRDITDHKRAEQGLQQARDASDALARSKSEFLANMSHEIRTPMNAIIGLSQLALNKEMPGDIRDYLEKINSSSESLLGILNDILDFSKMEAGKLAIENHHFRLEAILDNLRSLFSARAEEKHLDFNIEVAADTPADLLGDAMRIQQILSNLVGNALKFTERGKVEVRVAVLASEKSQVRFHFSVSDTGIGLSRADQAKLFQPFSQADASITRRFGGTGLGLAISRKLLQLMGSEFHVESEAGRGSVFSFELLLGVASPELQLELNRRHSERKAGALAGELRERGKALSGARVLVAEDNRINQQVVKEFLLLSGVIVDIAADGKEALQLLARNSYDAVLMDVHMPGMGGVEATERIRNQARYATLPIIALTAGVTQDEHDKCLACGMNDFVSKPVDPAALIGVLSHWIILQQVEVGEMQPATRDKPQSMLDEFPGFDFSNILAMVGGNEALLRKLLRTFRNESLAASNDIEVQIGQNNLAAAEVLVHTLKGSAGNLGAGKLHAAAETLDVALKQGKLNRAAYDNFRKVLLETEESLARLG